MNMKVNQNTANLLMAGMGGAATGAATGIGVYYFFYVRSSAPKDIKIVVEDKIYTDADKLELVKMKSNAARKFLNELKARGVYKTPGDNLYIHVNGEMTSVHGDVSAFAEQLPGEARKRTAGG